jgi:NAD(P)-dependent dehydrogenase (short-subunit alcohol dehydrogenase family)
MSQQSPTVVILGASRGLGLGLAREYVRRGWRVIATARSPEGKARLRALTSDKQLDIRELDITDAIQLSTLTNGLSDTRVDVLFANAGISKGPNETINTMSREDFSELFVTNALSPIAAIKAFRPLMKEDGVVVVMSSNLASIANITDGGWEVYRASKASLNSLLRSYASRHSDDRRTYLALSPGWVKTDMGGLDAPLDVETSVSGMLSVIDQRRGDGGVAFVDYLNNQIAW